MNDDTTVSKTKLQTEKQGSVLYQDAIDKSADKEKEILQRIKNRESVHQSEMDELIQSTEDNEKYYYATYGDDGKTYVGDDRIRVPKLFENLETLIPITTRQTPEPNVTVLPKSKKSSRKLEALLQSHLKDKWQLSEIDEGLEMQSKVEENMRNLFTQKVQIYKVFYVPELDDKGVLIGGCPNIMPIAINDVCFPRDARNEEEASFIIHYTTDTLGEIIKKFPDKEEALMEMLHANSKNISKDTIIKHIEYWENDIVAWAYKDLLLGWKKNPYYNWKDKSYNHFKKPRKPFIIETDLRHGMGLIGRTSYIEMCKSIVRNMDKRKTQIDRNAKLANGHYVTGSGFMDTNNAAELGRDTDKTIYLEDPNADPQKAVHIITGRAIDQAVVNDMAHDEAHIDKVTGINETLRGEKTSQETAEGRRILKESALTRNEGLFRMNERVGQKTYNWLIQFLYVFTPEKGGIRVYGAEMETGTHENITRDMLKGVRVLCYVKDGSMVPVDKFTEQTQAIERQKLGLLSNVDTLEKLDEPDAEGLAFRRYLQDNNPAALYDPNQNQEALDPRAKLDIYEISKGREVPIFSSKDPAAYNKHMQTNQAFLEGKPIDDEIDFIGEWDSDKLDIVKQHITDEAHAFAAMIATNQAVGEQPVQQLEQPVPQPTPGMPPAGAPAAPDEMMQLNQQLAQQINPAPVEQQPVLPNGQ